MTRCTQKTIKGKRCKKHASHDGKCLLHTRYVFSETSTESTVEVCLPTIDRKQELETFYNESVDAVVSILSRLTDSEVNKVVERASQRKRILELLDLRMSV